MATKKSKTSNLSGGLYTAKVHSFTHNVTNEIMVSRKYLQPEDHVLIVDDFLAKGNALIGLIELVEQAGAKVAGAAIAIEKGFQNGGEMIRKRGIRVESLAIIDSMTDDSITFRH